MTSNPKPSRFGQACGVTEQHARADHSGVEPVALRQCPGFQEVADISIEIELIGFCQQYGCHRRDWFAD